MFAALTLSVIAAAADQQEMQATVKSSATYHVRYLLSLPEGYEKSRSRFPILVFLHGSGERGDDLAKVAVHGPPRLVGEGRQIPMIVVSPQCDLDTGWRWEALSAMLTDIERKFRVDRDRVYVTGLSMGGFGSWEWAAREPDRFAAIIPICGGGFAGWGPRYARLPIWCVHGTADNVVPIARSEEMVKSAVAGGADVKFTKYEGVTHDSWTAFYRDQPWVEWLLQHRRKDRKGTNPAGRYVEETIKP